MEMKTLLAVSGLVAMAACKSDANREMRTSEEAPKAKQASVRKEPQSAGPSWPYQTWSCVWTDKCRFSFELSRPGERGGWTVSCPQARGRGYLEIENITFDGRTAQIETTLNTIDGALGMVEDLRDFWFRSDDGV